MYLMNFDFNQMFLNILLLMNKDFPGKKCRHVYMGRDVTKRDRCQPLFNFMCLTIIFYPQPKEKKHLVRNFQSDLYILAKMFPTFPKIPT